MMPKCEDYPACGHTDGLPCDWTSPNDNPDLWFCNHADDLNGGFDTNAIRTAAELVATRLDFEGGDSTDREHVRKVLTALL